MEQLLERDAELAALVARLDALGDRGEGGAVLIEGAAGIGKSSLLQALVDEAHARGAIRVLRARGTELELGLAFGAIRQLFAPVARRPDDERERLFAGPAALAAAVLGLRDLPHGGLADPLYALFWLVGNLAEDAPLVLAIDDVHWLDAESGRFVAYLARRLEGLRVVLVVTAREREQRVALEVVREVGAIVVPEPLTEDAARALAGAVPDAHRLTGGNPFLLTELARAAQGSGTSDVAASVRRRVARIGPGAEALAEAVAVFPAGARLGDAARAAGLHPASAAGAADALIEAQVLAAGADGRVEFLHPLMRAAVYDELGTFARRQLHAAAAQVLRARGAAAEHVAAHLLVSEPAGDPDAVRILRAAADEAVAAVAPRAAARYLARAVQEGAAQGEERRRLLLDLGRWQRVTGDEQARATLTLAFAEHRDAQTAIELAATAYSLADNALALRTAEAAAGVDATADERLVLDMLQAEALWAELDFDPAVRLIEQVPEDMPGDTPAQRMALAMAAPIRLFRGAPKEEVADMLRRSLGTDASAPGPVAGLDLGDPLQWFIPAEALDEAQAFAEERLAHARSSGDEALYAATQNSLGWLLSMRGELRAALAAHRIGLDSPALSPLMRAHVRLNLIETLIQMGELESAESELGAVGPGAFAQAEHFVQVRRAEIARWRGDFKAALPGFRAAYERSGIPGEPPHPNVGWAIAEYVDCLAAAGRREEALAIARDLVDRSERLGLTFGLGVHGAALARLTGDLADHERAVAVLAASPYRWYAARARLDLGAALRRAGQRVEAREQLRHALDYSEREGARLLAERAREELRVSGARLRDVALLSGADALTPAEARIAQLAVEGMSNKAIAQHLFVTVGTVQTTLVHVYRKLGIGGRKEIAGAIGDQDLWRP